MRYLFQIPFELKISFTTSKAMTMAQDEETNNLIYLQDREEEVNSIEEEKEKQIILSGGGLYAQKLLSISV